MPILQDIGLHRQILPDYALYGYRPPSTSGCTFSITTVCLFGLTSFDIRTTRKPWQSEIAQRKEASPSRPSREPTPPRRPPILNPSAP